MTAPRSPSISLTTLLTLTLWTSSAASQDHPHSPQPTTTLTPKRSTIAQMLTSPSTAALVPVECASDKSRYWICEGDRAWQTGYLVEPDAMRYITRLASERDGLRLLVGRLRIERDELRVQRDKFKAASKVRDVKLWEWEERERNANAWRLEGGESPWGDRLLWGGSCLALGVVIGLVVSAFAGGG